VKKADEMEMSINFKAMRLSWALTGACLAIWVIVEMALHGELPFIPFILLCLQSIVFFSAKLILTRTMVGAKRDEE